MNKYTVTLSKGESAAYRRYVNCAHVSRHGASTSRPRSSETAADPGIKRRCPAPSAAPALLHTVARIESGGRPEAVSSKGATGVMQRMPATARQYGVRDIRDVAENIEGAARLLRHLMVKYGGSIPLVLAAYNAGEGARGPRWKAGAEYCRNPRLRAPRAGPAARPGGLKHKTGGPWTASGAAATVVPGLLTGD